AALSTALAFGGGSHAAGGRVWGGRAAAGGNSFDGGAVVDISSVCASTGLTSIFACCAKLSDDGGTISPDCCDAGGASAGLSGTSCAVSGRGGWGGHPYHRRRGAP